MWGKRELRLVCCIGWTVRVGAVLPFGELEDGIFEDLRVIHISRVRSLHIRRRSGVAASGFPLPYFVLHVKWRVSTEERAWEARNKQRLHIDLEYTIPRVCGSSEGICTFFTSSTNHLRSSSHDRGLRQRARPSEHTSPHSSPPPRANRSRTRHPSSLLRSRSDNNSSKEESSSTTAA